MAKELPYFKFEPNEWENGNIQMLSREDKGLFIDLCSMYWSRLGDVPLKLAIQKLCGGNATALLSLCEEKIIDVIDDYIFIKFLSEQLGEFEEVSKRKSKNALDGWKKRKELKGLSDSNATASISQCENDAIREDKIIEDKIKETKNINSLSPINWESFLKFHNETFGKKARLINDTNKKKFLKLLKDGYTKEDIIKAMVAVKNDKWAIEKKYGYCSHLYFTRPDVIDRYAFPSEIKKNTNNYNGTL
jgi:hypothetical protein